MTKIMLQRYSSSNAYPSALLMEQLEVLAYLAVFANSVCERRELDELLKASETEIDAVEHPVNKRPGSI